MSWKTVTGSCGQMSRQSNPYAKKITIFDRICMTGIGFAKIVDGVIMVLSMSFIQTNFSTNASARFMNAKRCGKQKGVRQLWRERNKK